MDGCKKKLATKFEMKDLDIQSSQQVTQMDTKKTSSRGGYLSLQCTNTDAEGGWSYTSEGVTVDDG